MFSDRLQLSLVTGQVHPGTRSCEASTDSDMYSETPDGLERIMSASDVVPNVVASGRAENMIILSGVKHDLDSSVSLALESQVTNSNQSWARSAL